MSRREEQLRKERDHLITDTISKIYLSSIVEVLYEAEIPKEDFWHRLQRK